MSKNKQDKLKKLERDLDILKLMYAVLQKSREDLLKSLIYLEFNVDQMLKGSQKQPIYKENKEMKYHREQSQHIYKQIKNAINAEISKFFNGHNAKCFEYIPFEEWTNSGFATKTFID